MNKKLTNSVLPVVVLFATMIAAGPAWPQVIKKSNDRALTEIFGNEILSGDTRGVLRAAEQLDDDNEKYRLLSSWVMSSGAKPIIRVNGHFTPTDPLPVNGKQAAGGKIASPAMELIKAAKRCNQLDELFKTLSEIPDLFGDAQSQRLAMLTLTELARGNLESAEKIAGDFYEAVEASKTPLNHRWAELLVLDITSQVPALRDISKDILAAMKPVFNKNRQSAVAKHLLAASARVGRGKSAPLHRWHPSSEAKAFTRESGFPPAQWHVSKGVVRSVASHHADYLHYQTPLTGNFDIDAEMSTTAFQNGIIFVGGQWIQVTGPTGMYQGDYRSYYSYSPFQPKPLEKLKGWARYHTSVRGNEIVTLFNGREIDRRQFEYAPWIAIRNNAGAQGVLRNLRIVGQPTIPDTVYPLREGVQRWKSYQDLDGRWSTGDEHPNGSLTGNRIGDKTISSSPSLLHYHRPIVEDGVIEYEFFHKDGEFTAHPAVERAIFLIGADGIRLHWASHRPHSRSVGNQSLPNSAKPISPPISLDQDNWNRVRLTFKDDHVTLAINGVNACTHRLVQRQRRFGLFYDARTSALKVRNVRWSGDWPKTLPAVAEQELAGDRHECLVGLEGMTEFARIRFNQPLDSSRYETRRGIATETFVPNGLRVQPLPDKNYRGYWIGDRKRVYGDFDATLRFSDLESTSEGGQSYVSLRFLDETGNRYGAAVGIRTNNERIVCLKHMMLGKDGKRLYGSVNTGDEMIDGTLRLVRRDDVVHALVAYGDSKQFHWIASRRLREPESSMTLRIEVSRQNSSSIAAILHDVVVRSNPPGSRRKDPRISVLDNITRTYPRNERFNLTDAANDPAAVDSLDLPARIESPDKGIKLTAGDENAAIGCRHTLGGDFDVAFQLAETQLTSAGQLDLSIDSATIGTPTITLRQGTSGTYQAIAESGDNGKRQSIGTFDIESPTSLRMVRIQRTLFFIVAGKSKSQLIGYRDIGDSNIAADTIQLKLKSKSPADFTRVTSVQIRSQLAKSPSK